jgi:hypothetical protein
MIWSAESLDRPARSFAVARALQTPVPGESADQVQSVAGAQPGSMTAVFVTVPAPICDV